MRSLILISAVLSVFLAFAVGTAGAAQKRSGSAKLSVDVTAQRFAVEGGKVVARGPVTATLTRSDGTTETLHQRVNLRVDPTKNCQILDLHLAKLYLNLLGLQVRTSDINVKLTGDSKQALGKLFCKLSKGLTLGKNALAKRSAISLNKALDGHGLPVLSMTAPIHVQQQESSDGSAARMSHSRQASEGNIPPIPPGSCEVLDLFLGPLHLDLLGLVVDLYGATPADAVRVHITADPNGGVLGSTFCQLAGGSQA